MQSLTVDFDENQMEYILEVPTFDHDTKQLHHHYCGFI